MTPPPIFLIATILACTVMNVIFLGYFHFQFGSIKEFFIIFRNQDPSVLLTIGVFS